MDETIILRYSTKFEYYFNLFNYCPKKIFCLILKVIEGAGHQVYVQAHEEFNFYVTRILRRVNNGEHFDNGDKENDENMTPNFTTESIERKKSFEFIQSTFYNTIPNLGEEAGDEFSS